MGSATLIRFPSGAWLRVAGLAPGAPRRGRASRGALALLLLPLLAHAVRAQEPGPATNLETMRRLVSEIAAETAGFLAAAESVAVTVQPADLAWYVEPAIRGAFGARTVSGAPGGASVAAEFGVTDLRVVYTDARRDGFFGERLMDREVVASMAVKLVRRSDGAVLLNEEKRRSMRDTVAVESAESLENPSLPLTRAAVPEEGFFTNLVEPLVLIGALAVGIYLLFTVRS